MDERIYSYRPISADSPRTLILGTMPSVQSLREGFYYAHPRNAFWPMLAEIYGVRRPESIREKTALIRENGLALWDVVRSCVRPGSLDQAMREIEANDIAGFLRDNPGIDRILLNGGTAYRLFLQTMPQPEYQIRALKMPSTSPAYTIAYETKRAAWAEALIRGEESK